MSIDSYHHLTLTLNCNLKVSFPHRRLIDIFRLRNSLQVICSYFLKDIHVARNDRWPRLIKILLATIDYDDIPISLYSPILDQNFNHLYAAKLTWNFTDLYKNNVGFYTGMIEVLLS